MLLHASLAQPGLRPARPHDKPIATYVDRGEPIANERGPGERALRRARRTSTVQLGRAERDEIYRVWRDEVLLPSIAAGRAWRRGLACPLVGHSQSHVRSRSVGSLTEWNRELGRLPRSCERTYLWSGSFAEGTAVSRSPVA